MIRIGSDVPVFSLRNYPKNMGNLDILNFKDRALFDDWKNLII